MARERTRICVRTRRKPSIGHPGSYYGEDGYVDCTSVGPSSSASNYGQDTVSLLGRDEQE